LALLNENSLLRTRLSLFYIASFAAIGLGLPFWPVWLSSRGLSPADIGMTLAAGTWAKVALNPLVGHIVDLRGDRRRPMLFLTAATTLSFVIFIFIDGFWPILLVSMLASGLFATLLPLGESLTMRLSMAKKFDYARIRLWGSLSFIFLATGSGFALEGRPPEIILFAMIAGMGMVFLACLALPDFQRVTEKRKNQTGLGPLLKNRGFLLFLLVASLNQASHALYYGFATLHWQSQGLADSTIGLLWAEGVIVEIGFFLIGGKILTRFGVANLLLAACLAGTLRWTVIGFDPPLIGLISVQGLHALTFGAAHLAAMQYLTHAAPTELSARAQSLYSAVVMGAAAGLSMMAAGGLYASLQGAGFLIMAGFSALGAIACYALRRF
jgi:PPP family 3-phenylpropionic acid transporter